MSPFYHLIPKKEVDPLLSYFSTNHPSHVPLSTKDQKVHGLVDKALQVINEDPDAYKESIELLLSSFKESNEVKLEEIKFKKPVISSEGGIPPALKELPALQLKMLQCVDDVQSSDLADQDSNIAVPETDLLNREYSRSTSQCDELTAMETENLVSNYERKPLLAHFHPNKRIRLDPKQLADSTIAGIVDLVDKAEPSETSEKLVAGPNPGTLASEGELHTLLRYLTRLSGADRVSEVHADYLQRIQQICLAEIRQDPKATKRSVIAARIILIIISSKHLEMRLYLESLIASVVDFASRNITNYAQGEDTAIESVSDTSKLLHDLGKYLSHLSIEERILTKLEYCCLDVIFGKDGNPASELCQSLMSLLRSIFQLYDHQRRFLIYETLSNMTRMLVQSEFKKFSGLTSGSSISAFTMLLLKFIHCTDMDSITGEVEAFMQMPRSNNPQAVVNAKRQALLEKLAGKFYTTELYANLIASFCLEKLTTSEVNYKPAFLTFLGDLLMLLHSPLNPGAAIILSSLLSHLIKGLRSDTIQNANEPFALDILGRISVELLKLKIANSVNFADTDHIDILEILTLKDLSLRVLRASPAQQDIFTLMIMAKMNSLISKATSGVSQHGYFRSSPDKKIRASEAELALYNAMDLILSLSSKDANIHEPISLTYSKLMLSLIFNSLYDDFLSVLTQSLESSKVRLSTKAIKVLSSLIEVDTSILKLNKVSTSISRLLESKAALSREAIIDLLARYIASHNDLLERYYKPICARATDDSVAVRKRVIRILKSFVPITKSLEIKAQFCVRLLKSLEDAEENVKDLAKETLFVIWLSPQLKSDYRDSVSMMMSAISHNGLTQVLLEKYLSSSLKDKNYLLDLPVLKELLNASLNIATDKADSEEARSAELALTLVSIFASLDLELLNQDHLLSLQAYLTPTESGDNSCFLALKILRLAIARYNSLQQSFIATVQELILKKLTKYSVRELNEAVPVLSHLCNKNESQSRLTNALCSCLKHLGNHKIDADSSKGTQLKAVKLVQLLGCFGAFCHFEEHRPMIQKSNVGLEGDETVSSLIMRYIIYYTAKEHTIALRSAAIKSMLLVCSHHPKMFISKRILGILNAEFEDGTHRMKLTILEGIVSFLQKEDRDLAKRHVDETCSSERNLDVEVFHGVSGNNVVESVSLTLIQGFIVPTLELCLQDASPLSLIPVRFLEVVLKLGFVNPKICVPTIIALEASPDKVVRKIAFSLHKELFEKHESLADRSYTEAFKKAVQFSKRVYGEEFWKAILFLRTAYRVVSSNYSSRKKFVLSLCRLFKVDNESNDLSASVDCRDTIVLLVLNLSVLPFQSIEEVCFVLYHLDRIITHEGIDLAEKVNATVGSTGDDMLSVENLQLLFVHSQSVLALIHLRQTLSSAYAIPHSLMETFLPSRPDVELRQQPRAVTLIDYPLENLDMEVKLSNPSVFGLLFTKLVSSVRSFTM